MTEQTRRTALVLASSEGIGFACAHRLAEDGLRVVMASRSADKIQAAAARLTAQGLEAYPEVCDVTDTAQLDRVLGATAERFGAVDVLVNNHGGPPAGTALDVTDVAWARAFEDYAIPVLHAIRAVVPAMRARRFGRILTIGSIAVKMPIDGLDVSNFVRSGLAATHRTLARALAADGVTVNMLLPGSILTERSRARIQARADAEGRTFEAALAQSTARIPAGRLGTPDDVAHLAVFLASDRASYLTGTLFPVDGGMYPGLT